MEAIEQNRLALQEAATALIKAYDLVEYIGEARLANSIARVRFQVLDKLSSLYAEDGTSGQDRESYSDTQDRESYSVENDDA